jgi:hypothetical protein
LQSTKAAFGTFVPAAGLFFEKKPVASTPGAGSGNKGIGKMEIST